MKKYGFHFHDAEGHILIEKTYETFQSCLEAMKNPFFKDGYPWPFGIDFVSEEDGFVEVIVMDLVQFKNFKEVIK